MEDLKHSGLGVSTFIIGLISSVGLLITIVMAGVAEASSYGGMDPNSTTAMLIGLFMMLFLAMTLVTIGLGIAAFVQKGYKKLFPILGVCFSSVMAILIIGLMIIGLSAGY